MDWIFGYGSLIWRPAFDFEISRKAAVRGWRRRFWQASPDHRGVPEAPGRVVTLVPEPEALCWGMAFKPARTDWAAVMAELDHREQNGYERVAVELEFDDGTRGAGITYVAGPHNPSFIGPAPLADMAAQIALAVGPSGANSEYLHRLADVLDHLGVHDEEVVSLRAALTGGIGA